MNLDRLEQATDLFDKSHDEDDNGMYNSEGLSFFGSLSLIVANLASIDKAQNDASFEWARDIGEQAGLTKQQMFHRLIGVTMEQVNIILRLVARSDKPLIQV